MRCTCCKTALSVIGTCYNFSFSQSCKASSNIHCTEKRSLHHPNCVIVMSSSSPLSLLAAFILLLLTLRLFRHQALLFSAKHRRGSLLVVVNLKCRYGLSACKFRSFSCVKWKQIHEILAYGRLLVLFAHLPFLSPEQSLFTFIQPFVWSWTYVPVLPRYRACLSSIAIHYHMSPPSTS